MQIGLQDFVGLWRIDRHIQDRRLKMSGRFDGYARFLPDAEELVLSETGTLKFGNAAPMQATRSYRWRARGDVIEVLFEDGRAFHEFHAAASSSAQHLCIDDLYRVQYAFDAWPEWSSVWHVTGPRKDLVLTSRFVREEESG